MFLTKGVIYKATIKPNNNKMIYIGSTGSQFKNIFYEQMQSFRKKTKKDSTKLSNYIHYIKTNVNKTLKWEIMHKTKQNKPGKICMLCNMERSEITYANTKPLLNSRTELVRKYKNVTKRYLKT